MVLSSSSSSNNFLISCYYFGFLIASIKTYPPPVPVFFFTKPFDDIKSIFYYYCISCSVSIYNLSFIHSFNPNLATFYTAIILSLVASSNITITYSYKFPNTILKLELCYYIPISFIKLHAPTLV